MVESRTVGDYLALKICGEKITKIRLKFQINFKGEEDFHNKQVLNFQEEV